MPDVKASLRIYTKGYILDEVNKILGCDVDFGYSEGDLIRANNIKHYTETMWGKNSTHENSENIELHITELLDWLEQRKSEFINLASKADIKSDIFCYLSSKNGQAGYVFSADLLKRITDFNLDLVLDIYMSE